ncbi:MAG: glycosyltransferase family 9 protein [Gemmatimonadota bacterium]|nr:glycosyltransferase family 9 protein [Gemmatimonadota bacterium]MDH4347742.1 glycosyltransferase family 9 protein [Gemmatimonadota bacterium]MDH5282702.1 glycosyltransferase family 9 protein [Gemmatimonadota bacterium]
MPPDRTLVIQTAHLGDVVLTLPLLQHLAERFGPVDLLTTPAAAELARPHPAIRQVIPFDKRGAQRGALGLASLVIRLRSARYARAFLPHRSARSAMLALLAGIPERTGFGGRAAAVTYTRRIRYQADGHQVARLAALAGHAGKWINIPGGLPEFGTVSRGGFQRTGDALINAAWLPLTESDRRQAHSWLSASGVEPPFIVMAPGSRWGTKRWPWFADLAAALPDPIVVVGGPEDAGLAEAVVARAPGRIRSAVGALTLRGTAAALEQASLLVTNDSVPLHLASALNRPVVAIFGPTVTRFGFGPLSDTSAVVEHPDLPCRPCSPHGPMTCPRGHHRCLRDIPVARLVAAIEGLRV